MDFRSQSGICIGLGQGVVYSASKKQRINTKSSMEAELVSSSDGLGQVIWIRNFIQEQGYTIESAKVFQDNLSCIALVKSGRPTSPQTRHISIRYFFARDHLANKEIMIEYKATEFMVADIFTKHLRGHLFRKFRGYFLGDDKTDLTVK